MEQGTNERNNMCGTVFSGDACTELPGVVAQLRIIDGNTHRLGESVGGELALVDGGRADPELGDAAGPEGAIPVGGQRNGGQTGANACRGRSRAAVMRHRGYPGNSQS